MSARHTRAEYSWPTPNWSAAALSNHIHKLTVQPCNIQIFNSFHLCSLTLDNCAIEAHQIQTNLYLISSSFFLFRMFFLNACCSVLYPSLISNIGPLEGLSWVGEDIKSGNYFWRRILRDGTLKNFRRELCTNLKKNPFPSSPTSHTNFPG